MKHKKITSRFLALLICLSLVLTPIVALAAEGGSADDQDTTQTSEFMEADGALSAPSSDADEASFEDSADDTEEDADGESLTDPEDSGETDEDDPQEADPADPAGSDGGSDGGDMIDGAADDADAGEESDDGEAANAGETDYEFSDPDESEDAAPAEEINEIIEDLGEIPSGENPALAVDVTNATKPDGVWVELPPYGEDGHGTIRIDGFVQQNNIYELYLPGSVNASECRLFWDGGSKVTLNGVDYLSGTCPIPAVSTSYNGNVRTYQFSDNSKTLETFQIVTYQGSPDVKTFFIEIDETQGTIAAMDSDKNNECKGRICIDGEWFDLTKMKGRGNVSWDDAEDKKPYNITLGKKTDLGIDVEPTKKWSILAEITDHSLMCNRIGFAMGHALGVSYDATSADVWMNGEYQGLYTVTPKTDSYVPSDGYLIEEDNYKEPSVAEGGDPQFELEGLHGQNGNWASVYNLITVKQLGSNLKNIYGSEDAAIDAMRAWLQSAWDHIRFGDQAYRDYIDVASFAKVYLVEEYIKNYDVCAGSLLFHRDGNNDPDDKLIAGPLWDLDNAFGSMNDTFGGGVDLKRPDGNFILSINEANYKTSLYKTLYNKHDDFQYEVKRQYNMNQSVFTDLDQTFYQIMDQIEDSARMNHYKVVELMTKPQWWEHQNPRVYGNHYFANPVTSGSGNYLVTYSATTGSSKTNWDIYADNIVRYINVRSRWFKDNYYDPSICIEHDFDETKTEPTCTASGKIERVCMNCQYTETEILPALGHDPDEEAGKCTRCGEPIPQAIFECPEGVTVTAYYTKDFSDDMCVKDAKFAYCRDSKTGEVVMNDDGQVNFLVSPKDGYELSGVSVSAAPKNYKNLKGKEDTGVENGWRATKVTGDFIVTVSAVVSAVITFDPDNGSDPFTQSVPIGALAEAPADPVKEDGSTFEGWFAVDPETGDLADESFDFGSPVTAPVTLRAKWKPLTTLLRSATVEFTGNIHLVFKYDFPDSVLADERAYVSMKKGGKIVTIPVSDGVSTETGTAFKLPVMIPEFADDVLVTVWDGNGNRLPVFGAKSGENYTGGLTYSVKQYAEKMLENATTPGMDKLAEALYNYGTAAQIYFQYGSYDDLAVSDRVADESLNNEISTYVLSIDGNKPAGHKSSSIMTYFQSDNTLRINFKLDGSRPASDFTFKLDGKEVDVETSGENNYIYVKNIAAPLLDKSHEFIISDNDSDNEYKVNASAMSYAYSSVLKGSDDRKNLGRAFYLYNQAANDYFGE